MKQDFKKLFNLCLQQVDELLIVLDEQHKIQFLSNSAQLVLGWDITGAIGKSLDAVCKANDMLPFYTAQGAQNSSDITTNKRTFKIHWQELSYAAGVLLMGKYKFHDGVEDSAECNKFDFSELLQYPLLDIDKALRSFNQDRQLVYDVFKSMVEIEIPKDLLAIEHAEQAGDWTKVLSLVHKMKGGAMYCGTTKLQQACVYFEKHIKKTDTEQHSELLRQLLHICAETKLKIEDWLASKTEFFR